MKNKTIRITVDLPEDLYNLLNELAINVDLRKSDLIRHAIKLEKLLYDALKDNNDIVFINRKTGKKRELILLEGL